MEKVKIRINANVLFKMQEYAAYAYDHKGSEVSGWAHYNADLGIYKIAPLTKQEVAGLEVDNIPDEILNDMSYDISDLNVQWHSHMALDCGPSTTDKDNILNLLEIMPFVISIIVNIKGEYSAMLSFKQAGAFKFSKPLQFEVELAPYFSNPQTLEEIKTKLKKVPMQQPAKKNEKIIQLPSEAKKGSSLEKEFLKKGNPYNDMDEYHRAMKEISDDYPNEFVMYDYNQGRYLVLEDIAGGNFVQVTPQHVILNGITADWNDILRKFSLVSEPKYHINEK